MSTKRGTTEEAGNPPPPAKRVKEDDAEDDFAPLPVETAAAATATTTPAKPAGDGTLVPGMDTGRSVIIKQEVFPVPFLDMEHFSNFPDDVDEQIKQQTKRYLDEPHPSVKCPVAPFKDGKGGFATGWWLAFHHYNRDLPEYAGIRKDIIVCNLCGAQVKRGERARATSALVQHLKTKAHRKVFDQLSVLWEGKARDPLVPRTPSSARKSSSTTTPATGTRGSAAKSATNKRHEKAHTKQVQAMAAWLADTQLPVAVLQTPTFRNLCHVLQSTARVPPPPALTSAVLEDAGTTLAHQVQVSHQAALTGNVAFWAASLPVGDKEASRFVTAHFVDGSFTPQALLLNVSSTTMTVLLAADWGVTPGLTYQASEGPTCPGTLDFSSPASSSTATTTENGLRILRPTFVDQQLGTTAQIVLGPIQALVDKAAAVATQVGPSADLVPHKPAFWWTTVVMLEQLVALRSSTVLPTDAFTAAEWETIQETVTALQPLSAGVAALVAGGTALVALHMVRGELAKASSTRSKALLDDFDKTWGRLEEEPFQPPSSESSSSSGLHWSVLLAYVLDPRFKALPHIGSAANQQALYDLLLTEMKTAADAAADPAAEWKAYQDAPTPPADTTDPWQWWKTHAADFPTLAVLARVFLAMPVSAAAVAAHFRWNTSSPDPAKMTPEQWLIRSHPDGGTTAPAAAPTPKAEPPTPLADPVSV